MPPAISQINTSFVRWRGVGPAFSLPRSFHSGYALSPPLLQPCGCLQAAVLWDSWMGGSSRRLVPKRQPGRSRISKLDENSGLHMGLWWGHHSLRGTERCLSEQILVLGSNWEGDFLCPETLLFHIQSLFSAFGSHVPRPPPLPASTSQGCYSVALFCEASNFRCGPRTLKDSLLLSGRKESQAFRRPQPTPSHPAAGNRRKLLPSSHA